MDKKFIIVGVVGGVSIFATGFIAGCGLAAKKLRDEHAEAVSRETREAKKFYKKYYATLHKKDEYGSPAIALETLGGQEVHDKAKLNHAVDALLEYQGEKDPEGWIAGGDSVPQPKDVTNKEIVEEHQKEEPVVRVRDEKGRFIPPKKDNLEEIVEKLRGDGALRTNIFADAPRPALKPDIIKEDVEGKEDKEESKGDAFDSSKPYLLTSEEFLEDKDGYTTASYTYYAGDGVLVDDDGEEVIPPEQVTVTVGTKNLEMFGYLQNDPYVVLVRNEILNLNIEIAYSDGKYAKEVLDLEGDDG